jgi:hypothetical protein
MQLDKFGRAKVRSDPRGTRYIDEKYGVEEAEKTRGVGQLMQQLFVRRK